LIICGRFNRPVSLLLGITLLLTVIVPLAYGQTDTPKATEDIVIRMANYVARISKDAFVISITRGDELIFETGRGGDAATSLEFLRDEKPQHVTQLAHIEKNGNFYVLSYNTTHKDVVARVELHAEQNVLHVKSWVLEDSASPRPNLAVRLAPSGDWFGGGFQGFREPLVLPVNDAHIRTRWFLADGNTQGTPFWYSSKGVGIWIRTPFDFKYSINEEIDGKADGLLRIESPQAWSSSTNFWSARHKPLKREFQDGYGRPE